jgi:GH24 family phage-related lysozyme (muramidase)
MWNFLKAMALALVGSAVVGVKQAQAPTTDDAIFAAVHDYLSQPTIEGYRLKTYRDKLGFLSVGIGHKILSSDGIREGSTITPEKVAALFKKDANAAIAAAKSQARELGKYNMDMIVALASVNFQLGTGWRTEFKNTWNLIKAGRTPAAIQNLNSSLWARQTPNRVLAFTAALQRNYA